MHSKELKSQHKDHFCKKICHPKLSKIAQSGHTDLCKNKEGLPLRILVNLNEPLNCRKYLTGREKNECFRQLYEIA